MKKDSEERFEKVIRLLAHDLRNPLSIVRLNAQLLERSAASAGQGKQQRLASTIVMAAGRMDEMLQQLVDAERIRSGKIPLVLEPVGFDQLLAEFVSQQNLGREVPRARLMAGKKQAIVLVDRARLGQALTHLLGLLAAEATARASVVSVEIHDGADGDVVDREGLVTCCMGAPRQANDGGDADTPGCQPGQASQEASNEAKDGLPLHLARTVIDCHGGTSG